ncbi:Uncharacterised protein [Burkholderia pseudomallei]|uniref:hypothetical protein n=1 Tax=Burkholderia pseudomallei TaxID=28450 RepID=UPI00155D97FE|nr:hypothetical protein [Burkholderia pseudomallei]CAJ6511298.1 Uncharacterised protein [Burkholderia pseudomallei]CAJ7866879.1 Uncharacterised protein [Burkholderia pseudomallei]
MTTWTDEQLADYECALETIGNAIALKARGIEEEKAKPVPNADRLADLRQQQAELAGERRSLRIGDHDAVAHTIRRYGQIVRASA